MAFRSRVSPILRSSLSAVRTAVTRRALTSQSKDGASSFCFAGPLLIGASAATAGLFAATQLYKNNFFLIGNVHAATKAPTKGKHERTFIMVKPDGVQRGLVGDIIKRFEQKGFKLVAMKFMQASEDHLREHYADLSHLPFFPGLVKHMASGPVVAMVWEGLGVVKTGRVMLGETDPAKSQPGTIRGDFCIQIGRQKNKERTFLMLKPDAVHRGLVADIIKRFEQKGFKLVAMKFMQASKELLEQHYEELKDKKFFPGLVKYMSSGPVVPMVWEGLGVVKTCRDILGETDPAKSKPGSVRGDFSIHIGRNICHGSDSVKTAKKEIALWFKDEELVDWKPVAYPWLYEDV
ncbi:nucleoside diphosphate kinase III, chloroplastic/mitochondrial-like [Orbicella faveolata]|uniref:nucleoside diphosphate kinase III, chloroplastic/mitochondrial-like n=1 Tax=Orbicella faveolata TaxID=48498 RepID=UPI0009E65998|nr:nucleoside diphosphate kinase III, chloroplastic/mitochondrial-like [Orbicella faveolata]